MSPTDYRCSTSLRRTLVQQILMQQGLRLLIAE